MWEALPVCGMRRAGEDAVTPRAQQALKMRAEELEYAPPRPRFAVGESKGARRNENEDNRMPPQVPYLFSLFFL